MERTPINLQAKLALFADRWSPKVVAQMNEVQFKLVKVKGEFVWHRHGETDETFLILLGELVIEFRDGEVRLGPGEMFVVPKGVEHRPVAREECSLMLIEPAGVVNTGDVGSDLTAPNDVWI